MIFNKKLCKYKYKYLPKTALDRATVKWTQASNQIFKKTYNIQVP